MSTTDTRAAFEATVCEIVPRPLFLLNEDGSYQEIMVRGFWKLWNAAIAHASHIPKEVSGQGCALCGNGIGHDLECKNHPANAATEAAKATGPVDFPEGSALKILRDALWFYADKEHFIQLQDVWESVSGEPENFLEDESHTATVEDGTVAKNALNAVAGYTGAKATGTAGEPVAYLRFRAAQQWSGIGGHDIEYNEWLETCHAHEVGDDGKPAFPVFDSPALLHADSDIFDLIREWAALPEGKRHDAARAIIGSVNRSYSAGVADGKVLGEAARQPAPVVDKKLSDTVKPVLTPEDFGILDPELSKRAVNFHNAMVHQAALAATAAPVLGLKMVCDPNMPSDQVEFRMNGETVGRIVNIATRSQP